MPSNIPFKFVDGTIVTLEVELTDTMAELKARLNVSAGCVSPNSGSLSPAPAATAPGRRNFFEQFTVHVLMLAPTAHAGPQPCV